MNIYFILYLLFIHWVADFVCQTNYQAQNKSKDNEVLTEHAAIYSLGFLYLLLPWRMIFGYPHMDGVMGFLVINLAAHWVVDYFTSRLNSFLLIKARQTDNYHNFFVSIGFDQFIHCATLILTANWLLK